MFVPLHPAAGAALRLVISCWIVLLLAGSGAAVVCFLYRWQKVFDVLDKWPLTLAANAISYEAAHILAKVFAHSVSVCVCADSRHYWMAAKLHRSLFII